MVDIKLKNKNGQDVTYEEVDTITVPLADGSGEAEFIIPEIYDGTVV